MFLTRTKRRKMTFFEGCPVGWGGGVGTMAVQGRVGLAVGGVARASVAGGRW